MRCSEGRQSCDHYGIGDILRYNVWSPSIPILCMSIIALTNETNNQSSTFLNPKSHITLHGEDQAVEGASGLALCRCLLSALRLPNSNPPTSILLQAPHSTIYLDRLIVCQWSALECRPIITRIPSIMLINTMILNKATNSATSSFSLVQVRGASEMRSAYCGTRRDEFRGYILRLGQRCQRPHDHL